MDETETAAAHCPSCGMDYRTGFDTCVDDGSALLPGPAPVPGEPDPTPAEGLTAGDAWGEANQRLGEGSNVSGGDHPEPAVLCRLPADEAVLLAGALVAAGIEAMAENQGYRFPYVNSPTLSGQQNVLVPADRLEQARRIARELLGDAEV